MSEVAPEVLLSQVSQGSVGAMEAFYQLYERTIYRYALSRLSDPFDAAEVLNDVMLEVWRQAGRFEGRSAVSTWLIGMARHKVLDRHRARGRHAGHVSDEFLEDMADENPAPDRALGEAQDAQRMRLCIDKLGPNHREVVHLAFYEDWSQEQIAEVMQCPTGTIKSRMYHAKEAIKKCLERWTTPS
jgi:RNA polymerase sigma-70 factor, ECF subfamily